MEGITKVFPGVKALDEVDFSLHAGEVHALLGENGAGKSTLMKVLSGIHNADEGSIFLDGEKTEIRNVHDSQDKGISIIHQELVLVPHMTVAENIFLGRELKGKRNLFLDYQKMHEMTQELLKRLCDNVQSDDLIEDLSVAQQQMVEIARSLSFNCRILVMDEPTAALTDKEVALLFDLIRDLKSKGMSIVYISHRMEELFEISDRVSVLRDGQYIGTKNTKETTRKELIDMMVGRSVDEFYKNTKHELGETILEVRELYAGNYLHDINFKLRRGEILGVSGIVGAGRTELMRILFGIDSYDRGEIRINGERVAIESPEDAIKQGIVLVPENRKEEGLYLGQDVAYNLTIQSLSQFINGIMNKHDVEESIVDESIKRLSIKTAGSHQVVNTLSGGNQQKIVIAKWLATKPDILILDEPTRGVDVGAKSEIYAIMDQLVREGVSIIMVSSELPEIVNMSDRVIVMAHGEITGSLEKDEITQQNIMHYATHSKSFA